MLSLAHKDTPISRWSLSSTIIHILALCGILFWNVHEVNNRPKKLLVKTVSVREFQQTPPQKEIKKLETKKSVDAPPKPVEIEKVTEIAVAEPREDTTPIPEPVTPQEIPQQADPTPEIKPEPVQKPTPKKETPKEAPKQAPKQTPKAVQKPTPKPQPQSKPQVKPQQVKPQSVEKKPAPKPDTSKKEAEVRAKQQKLSAALEQLNQVSTKNKSLVAVGSEPSVQATRITTLESDSISSVSCEGAEEYSSKDARYISELIRRLKLTLRLPEYGEVRIKLVLNRSGTPKSMIVLKSSMKTKTVEQQLKGISFPAFGSSFPGEQEHSFTLILANEL